MLICFPALPYCTVGLEHRASIVRTRAAVEVGSTISSGDLDARDQGRKLNSSPEG